MQGFLFPALILAFLLGAALLLLAVVRGWLLPGRSTMGHAHLLSPAEPSAADIDQMDWDQWVRFEDRLFQTLAHKIPALGDDQPWRRSQRLLPAEPPVGAVVLLHGLSDSPWSLHHFAGPALAAGFAVVAPRLPGHGTVPSALLRSRPEQWVAVTALALREAQRIAGQDRLVSIIGYSNGAALALMAALRPAAGIHRLVLISPMIGVRSSAALAGLAAWPARLNLFRASAWLRLGTESNPYKYRSFPLVTASHSRRISRDVQQRLGVTGAADRLPPMLIAQSIADNTVEIEDLERALLHRLTHWQSPQHRLLLFGLNAGAALSSMVRPELRELASAMPDRMPAALRTSLIDAGSGGDARVHGADSALLPGCWPPSLLSLGHIALPYPPDDPVFGISAEQLAQIPHGETGILAKGAPDVPRISCNPCFPFLLEAVMSHLTGDPLAKPPPARIAPA